MEGALEAADDEEGWARLEELRAGRSTLLARAGGVVGAIPRPGMQRGGVGAREMHVPLVAEAHLQRLGFREGNIVLLKET